MYRSEQISIKQEFDKSVKYLHGRKEKLTIGECLQEIGALRLFIYSLGTKETQPECTEE